MTSAQLNDSRRGRPLLCDPGPALVSRPRPLNSTSSSSSSPARSTAPPRSSASTASSGQTTPTTGDGYYAPGSLNQADSGCVSRDSGSGTTSASSLHAAAALASNNLTATNDTLTADSKTPASLPPQTGATTHATSHAPSSSSHVASDDDDSGCAIEEYSWVPNGLNHHQVCITSLDHLTITPLTSSFFLAACP